MKYSVLTCIIWISASFAIQAQSLEPVLVAIGGGYGSGQGGNLSWSVGEPVIFTSTPLPHLTQGFHQPRVNCDDIDSTLITTGSKICEGTNAVTTVADAVRGFNYRAYLNDLPIGEKSVGDNEDLYLILPFEALAMGENIIHTTVQRFGCDPKDLPDTALVEKVKSIGKMPPISYTGTLICIPVSVYLFAKPNMVDYQWVLNDTLIPNANQNLYIAPTPGSYEVMGFTPEGCLSASDSLVLTNDNFVSPSPPQIIQPAIPVCNNDYVLLSLANSSPAFTYRWRFNTELIYGATGPTYEAILPGFYTVQVLDENGCSNLSNIMEVELHPSTFAPVITFSDNLLRSNITNPDYVYQWYAAWDSRKRAIIGAEETYYKPLYNATYYVSVRHDTCTILSSGFDMNDGEFVSLAKMGFFYTDSTIVIPDELQPEVLVFPNPATDAVTIQYISKGNKTLLIQLLDIHSRILKSTSDNTGNHVFSTMLDLKEFNSGIHFLSINDGTRTYFKKIILE